MEADALIIGMPIYFYGPHAYYKLLTDRLLGTTNYLKHTRGKPCVIIMPFGGIGMEGYGKTAAMMLPRILQMKLVDCWQVNAALPGECMLDEKNIEHARSIGENLIISSVMEKGPSECPFCGADLFRILPDGKLECPICRAQGTLGEKNEMDFSSYDFFQSTPEAEEHCKALKNLKAKFLKEKDRLKAIQKKHEGNDWWIKPNK